MSIKKILASAAIAAGLFATPMMVNEAEAAYGRRVARAAVRGAYYGGTPYYGNRYYGGYSGYSRPYTSYYGGYGRAYSPYYGNSYYRPGGYGYGNPGYYGRSGVSIGIGGYPGYYGSGLRIGF